MDAFDTTLLSVVDDVSRRFALLTRLIDGFLERLLPQATVHACGGCPADTSYCGSTCYECTPDAEGTLTWCMWFWQTSCSQAGAYIDCTCC